MPASSSPEKIVRSRDVFGISRDLPENYVVRSAVDERFVDCLTRNKHLIVHGGSKQGKTSLRKYNLNETDYILVACHNKWNLGDLNAAILKSAGYQVTQSSSKTFSGGHKITVKIEGKGKIPFIAESGASGQLDVEKDGSETVVTKPLDLDPTDTNDIIGALTALQLKKFIILEDFHYLPQETQRDFSFSLKAFHEQSPFTFIIVGVWKEENRLTRFNGDLTNRVIPIDADTWQLADLEQVVSVGEALLNIQFDSDFKSALIKGSFNSVYIVQEACFRACESARIYETQAELFQLQPERGAEVTIKEVVKEQSGRYRAFLNAFCAGFSPTKLEMYKWIIFVVLTATVEELESGLRLNQIVRGIRGKHPEGIGLQTANVTNALANTSSLQAQMDIRPIVLDYDENERRLDIVDKGFLVWMSVVEIDELLTELDLPTG